MLNWKIVTLSMRRLDCVWFLMVNMPSEKQKTKRAWSDGRGQLACGKTVKHFSVCAPALDLFNTIEGFVLPTEEDQPIRMKMK